MQGGRAPWQPPSLRKKPRFSGARCSDTRKGSPALWGVPSTHQRLRTHLARRSLIRLLGARYAPLREKDSSHYRVTEGIGPICRGRLQTIPTQFHRERAPKGAREKRHARVCFTSYLCTDIWSRTHIDCGYTSEREENKTKAYRLHCYTTKEEWISTKSEFQT
jgi:hypothetical protein